MTSIKDANFYRDLKKEYPVIESGKGICIYDNQGKEYLDFGSGIGVATIGYSVAEIVRKMAKQMEKITFVYNGYFTNRPRMALSEKLLGLCPEEMSKVIFAGSGSEANEIAIKMARQYHCETGNPSKYKVISRQLSYHGNTLGSLSVSGRDSWRGPFLPYLYDFPRIAPPYCYRCPFGLEHPTCGVRCAGELEDAIKAEGEENVSAFIAEPIIGTTVAGATPPPEYYATVRSICDKYNVLFIADEVLTGLGRTGKNFGINHWDIVPDIITVAKGLSAGYAPLSAAIFHNRIFEAIAGGSRAHCQGFTYAGNPLSCAAGLAVLNYIESNGLIERSRIRGEYLRVRLETLREIDLVGDIRGKGLLQGIEFVKDKETKDPFPAAAGLTRRITEKALAMGLVLIAALGGCADGTNGDQVQLSPAFIITETEIDRAVEILAKAIVQAQEEVLNDLA